MLATFQHDHRFALCGHLVGEDRARRAAADDDDVSLESVDAVVEFLDVQAGSSGDSAAMSAAARGRPSKR